MTQLEHKHEAASAAWVQALREQVICDAEGKPLDFELTFCAEYLEPPQHLLRADGRATVGYCIIISAGQIEVSDGARDNGFDVRVSAAYDPVALHYHLPRLEFLAWMGNNGGRLMQEGGFRIDGDGLAGQRLSEIVDLVDIYSRITATPFDHAGLCEPAGLR